jgi:hypothetical protein
MKRKKDNNNRDTDNNSAPNPSSQTVIDINDDDDTQAHDPSRSLKRSWVWNHFIESKETGEAICQVPLAVKNGKICGSRLKKDRSGSTKNLHGHLLLVHDHQQKSWVTCMQVVLMYQRFIKESISSVTMDSNVIMFFFYLS